MAAPVTGGDILAFKALYLKLCSDRDVEAIDPIVALCDNSAAAGLTTLKEVSLYGGSRDLFTKRITDEKLSVLVDAIIDGQVLIERINVSYNKLTDFSAEKLCWLLMNTDTYTCTIKEINLQGNDITGEGFQTLVSGLLKNSSVNKLNVSFNPLGRKGGMAAAELISKSKSITHLELGSTELETDSIIAIAEVLTTNDTIERIGLANPRLFSRTHDSVFHVAKMLERNKVLTSLDLSKNNAGEDGAKLLAEYLAPNKTLVHLELRNNNIASEGGEALAGLIVGGSPITHIDLSSNRIGDSGAKAWRVAISKSAELRVNGGLSELNLLNNEITDDGLAAIADGVKTSDTLSKLTLWGNKFGQKSLTTFAALLSTSPIHESLVVDFKPYEVDLAMQVARVDL